MRRIHFLLLPLVLLPVFYGCQNQAPPAEIDMADLRQAVLQQTEKLYAIHLKLDTAATDILKAESLAESGDCSSAQYVAADAYRNVERADEELLDLGRDLQALFNLDVESANR
jgi:hypothetical protein